MRTVDNIIRDVLGNHVVQIIQLTARVEELEEQLKQAQAPNASPDTSPTV